MTLGLALLGTGRIAESAFVPAIQAVTGAQLVAVLSRDLARGTAFARKHHIPAAYDNLEALLRNPQVDAVIVATPDASHEPQVIAAARAGKHILCEKPMTTTYGGCERMATAVRASGVTFAMGYNNRFNTGLRQIKTLLDAGEIGKVRYARSFLISLVQDPNGWRARSDQARYWALSAVGTHLIDIWRWYFGDPARIGGGMISPVHGGPHDEIATLVFDYPERLLAELSVGVVFRGVNRLELYGDAGTIIGEGLFGSSPGKSFMCKDRTITFEAVNPFIAEVSDFVQAVEQHRSPCVTLEDGMRNVAIMETARTRTLLQPLKETPG